MEKKVLSIIGIFVLAALIYVGYMQYHILHTRSSEPKQHEIPGFNVQTIRPAQKTVQNFFVGYVKPIHQVSIVPSITGTIERVAVQGGATVETGDLLFTIEPDQYKAQLDLAIAKVAQATAALTNARQYESRVQKAGQRAVSQTDLDNAKTRVLTAEAELAEAKANENLARVNYGYATLTAPISGTIGDVQITRGDYVSPESGALAQIIQFNPIRVIFSISDKEYLTHLSDQPDILNGWQVKLRLADGRIYPKPGQIKYINNEISASTGSLVVYADFDNPDKALLANAYVDVLLEKQITGIFIPKTSVHLTPTGGLVYTLSDGGTIEKTPVTVGVAVDDDFYIPTGLTEGMRVITDNVATFQIGKRATAKGTAK